MLAPLRQVVFRDGMVGALCFIDRKREMQVGMCPNGGHVAVGAIATSSVVCWVLAEKRLREGKSQWQLAGTLRSAKHDGMRQLVLRE